MLPNQRLKQCLPLKFKNGALVKQFSKPCVSCGEMLQANDMLGIARLVENHIAIAAKAHCPKCDAEFGVCCIIDDEKKVRRLILPQFAFNLYLRNLPLQAAEIEAAAAPREVETTPVVASPAPRIISPANIQRAIEVIGSYQAKPIPAWVVVDGQQLNFDRVSPDARVADGEFLLDGCFIYRG
ncbi:hypothetical protein [Iodobacter fluviatilis]|jgi:hypothetical protein|nr:hypothetical protein [Iodobacter fluviatilis]